MTPEQIDLVRKSFDALWPFRRKLAGQFYGRFFELAPVYRTRFIGHKFELSGLLHAGLLPSEPRLARAA